MTPLLFVALSYLYVLGTLSGFTAQDAKTLEFTKIQGFWRQLETILIWPYLLGEVHGLVLRKLVIK